MSVNGVSNIKRGAIAKGKMSDLLVYANIAQASPSITAAVGRSRLGPSGLRDVDFYPEGVCVQGSQGAKKCGSKECSATLPIFGSNGVDPCWIRYDELKKVGSCTDVKLDAMKTSGSSTTEITVGGVTGRTLAGQVQKPDLQITNNEIALEADRLNGIQCMLAGCDYDPVPSTAAGTCKEYTKPNPKTPEVTGSVLASLKKGFTFEPTKDIRYSIGVMEAASGGGTDNTAGREKQAKNVYSIRDYAVDMQGLGASIGLMFYLFAVIMSLCCFLTYVSPEFAGNKYTQGEDLTDWWWLSTLCDWVHLFFAIGVAVVLGMTGRFFKPEIEGNGAEDTTRSWNFWFLPNLLFWPLLVVGLHGVIYTIRKKMNPSQQGQTNVVAQRFGDTDIIFMNRKGDPNFEQRASMVRNNLNV